MWIPTSWIESNLVVLICATVSSTVDTTITVVFEIILGLPSNGKHSLSCFYLGDKLACIINIDEEYDYTTSIGYLESNGVFGWNDDGEGDGMYERWSESHD